ncbi:MAG: alanine racemase [Chloroflexota bacterium]
MKALVRRTSAPDMGTSDPHAGRITRVEIDLDAIAANTKALAGHVHPARLMTVVKGNAYGHGAIAVARTALRHGAAWLGVYTVGEGAELRTAGIEAPILVFGPYEPDEAQWLLDLKLTPTVSSIEQASLLARLAQGTGLPFHLEVDSGMTRAGVPADGSLHLMQKIAEMPGLQPEGIYTHFARAGETDSSHALHQLRVFLETCTLLEAHGFSFRLKHAANSAAALALPAARLDLVRCGIATYGCSPSDRIEPPVTLQPALSWRSAITRIARVPPGTGVGYGHQHVCPEDSVIALVPVGYGDGLSWNLGDAHWEVGVHGRAAPVVGRVSMDQITVDLTGIPDAEVGDAVTIIGVDQAFRQTASDLASKTGTINYEVLTRILPRVPRVYLGAVARTDSIREAP